MEMPCPCSGLRLLFKYIVKAPVTSGGGDFRFIITSLSVHQIDGVTGSKAQYLYRMSGFFFGKLALYVGIKEKSYFFHFVLGMCL